MAWCSMRSERRPARIRRMSLGVGIFLEREVFEGDVPAFGASFTDRFRPDSIGELGQAIFQGFRVGRSHLHLGSFSIDATNWASASAPLVGLSRLTQLRHVASQSNLVPFTPGIAIQ